MNFKFPSAAHQIVLEIATNHRAWLYVKVERKGEEPLTMANVSAAMADPPPCSKTST